MRRAAVLGGIVAIACVLDAASAQEPVAASQPVPPSLEFRPTIAVSTGYDSNPDEEPEAEGAAFDRLDLGLRASVGADDATQAGLDASGTVVDYLEGDQTTDYDYSLDFAVTHPVNDGLRLSFGGSHERDETDDPPTIFNELWTAVAADFGSLQWEIRGAVSEYREIVSREEIEDYDLENWDYRMATVELRTEWETERQVNPLLELRLSGLDYIEQRSGKRNRDAAEYSVMAGAEIGAIADLRLQLGVRRSERIFEEPGAGSYATTGLDIELAWEATDRLSIEADYEQSFEEPSYADGIVRDVDQLDVEIAYQATDRLALGGGASVRKVREVGLDYRKTELEAFADAAWALHENLDLILEASTKREVRHDDPGETNQRATVRAGVEATF